MKNPGRACLGSNASGLGRVNVWRLLRGRHPQSPDMRKFAPAVPVSSQMAKAWLSHLLPEANPPADVCMDAPDEEFGCDQEFESMNELESEDATMAAISFA